MEDLKYQLVFQFDASEQSDFLAFVELTSQVEEGLKGEPETFVDGHDFGLGEFNIFIHTNHPEELFETTADVINRLRPGVPFSAGYRSFDEDMYHPLHPPSAKSFSVA